MRTPLDGFHVDWDKKTDQNFETDKIRYTPEELPAPSSVSFLFDWINYEKGKYYGRAFEDLWYSRIDLSEEDKWQFDRPLGKGGFGAAALFKKYNERGEVIDDVVIKSTEQNWKNVVNDSRQDLAKEAAIMAQTNDLNTESLLFLRQYKCYGKAAQFRFFLENCDYGDIERLRLRYKAWQRYLPDYFLWHLFYWLIEGASNLQAGPFRHLNVSKFGEVIDGGYMIHSDIKTENVFLGPQSVSNTIANDYPAPRIADFGLATLTRQPDITKNVAKVMQRGTTMWFPPEIRYKDLIPFSDWYPFKRWGQKNSHDKGSHVITAAANVWAIGASMWSFVTGQEIDDLSNHVDAILSEKIPFLARGHILPDIKTGKTPEYDNSMLELIRDCLKLVPDTRPSMSDLRSRVLEGLKHRQALEAQEMQKNPEVVTARLKVYYKENEINELPLGNAKFKLTPSFWSYFVRHTLWLPEEWGPLLPPGAPTHLRAPATWPKELREKFERNLDVGRRDLLRRAMPTEALGQMGNPKRKSEEPHAAQPSPGSRVGNPTGQLLTRLVPTNLTGLRPTFGRRSASATGVAPGASTFGERGRPYPWGPDDVGQTGPRRTPTPFFDMARAVPMTPAPGFSPGPAPGLGPTPSRPAGFIRPTTERTGIPAALLPGYRPGLAPRGAGFPDNPYRSVFPPGVRPPPGLPIPAPGTAMGGYVPAFYRPAAFRFDTQRLRAAAEPAAAGGQTGQAHALPLDLARHVAAHPIVDPAGEEMSDIDLGSGEA